MTTDRFTICERTGKRAFRTEVGAKRRRSRRMHQRLRVYRCPFCGLWHLTKQEHER